LADAEANRQGLPDCGGATSWNCAIHSIVVSRGVARLAT
jgi:hypothetical protein